MQGLIKSALPVALSRAPTKLGYHWQREGAGLVSRRVLPDPSSFHIVDQYVDVARALGAETLETRFELVPSEEAVLSVRLKLKQHGVSGRFVALNPGAGWSTKRWPAAHFAALAEALAGDGMQCVLLGGSGAADRAAALEVIEACREAPASLVGETSIAELIALVRLCSAHVGGDTGSSHIAAAVGVPAIGLYSITRPERSCPYGQRDRCHYDPSGLANIGPGPVIETVREALAG
jgi:ADP-heptose:LPS heptosyltransferase